MDFILGIFTGISIAILWGMYLNKQREKKGVPKHRNPPPPPLTKEEQQYWDKTFGPHIKRRMLHLQIQDAIERDDFEEAARLRDLMNKK